MVLNIDWLYIEIAFVIASFFFGLWAGWKYMAIWAIAVFFAGLAADGIGPKLGLLLNKLLSVGGQFIALALGRDENSISTPTITISDVNEPLGQAILFLILIVVTTWIARKLGNKAGVGLLGLILGGVFGALGTVLVLSKLAGYYQSYVAKGGTDVLAQTINLTPPGLSLGAAGGSGAASWAGLGGIALLLFLTIFVLYVVWRSVRTIL